MAQRLISSLQCIKHQVRNISYNSGVLYRIAKTSDLNECSAVSDDGRLVACWHPEQPIPYEQTRPLTMTEMNQDPGVLKKADLSNLQRPQSDELVRERLMALTSTTKHRWFPKASRHKKQRKRTFDREYL